MKTLFLLVMLLPLGALAQTADEPLSPAEQAATKDAHYKLLPSDTDQRQMEQALKPGSKVDLAAFLKNPEDHFWTDFYQAADQLFAEGHKKEALKWFYAGQLRARVAAGLDPDASRNNALLVSFNGSIGKPILEYAKSDKINWAKQVDAALVWDRKHALPADPALVIGVSDVAFDKANFEKLYDLVRAGLVKLREQIAAG